MSQYLCEIPVTQKELDKARDLLKSPIVSVKDVSVLHFTGEFGNGMECDINVVLDYEDGEVRSFAECLIIDAHKNFVKCSEPADTIEEDFNFYVMESNDYNNCLDEVIYTVRIVVKE